MFIIVLIGFGISVILLLSEVNFANLYPVTTTDIVSSAKGSIPLLSTWVHYIFILFLLNKVKDPKTLKKNGFKTGIILTIIGTLVVIVTVGIFGAKLTKLFSIPYFISLKEIEILNNLYGLESIFLSLLMLGDFAAAGICVFIIHEIIRKIFELEDKKQLTTPIIFAACIFSLWIANNRFEMHIFTGTISVYMSLIFEVAFPLIILAIGKMRKKV